MGHPGSAGAANETPFSAVVNSCRSCNSKCCRGLAVVLTIPEAIRLKENLALKPEEYLELTDLVDSRKTPHFPLLAGEGGRLREYFIIIKKKNGNNDCFFLNQAGTCGSYSCRPSVCKLYPFELTDSKRQKKGALCPIKFIREPQTDREAELLEEDLKRHGIMARRWNIELGKISPIGKMLDYFKANPI